MEIDTILGLCDMIIEFTSHAHKIVKVKKWQYANFFEQARNVPSAAKASIL